MASSQPEGQTTAAHWMGYVIGPTHPNTQAYATFETKPTPTLQDNFKPGDKTEKYKYRSSYDTGGGYERWRDYGYKLRGEAGNPERLDYLDGLDDEPDPSKKTDLYAPHHRLLAVVACYPVEMPLGEVLDDLRGKDVHHNAPEVDVDAGVEWDNRHECLEVMDHGRHSEVTQRQMISWAKDRKQRVEEQESMPVDDPGECGACGGEAAATVEGVDGVWCLECAAERAGDGRTVEVL